MATTDDRALAMIVSKIEAGETLAECYRLWILWGLTGVAQEQSALWEAVGREICEIEDVIGVNAIACHAGTVEQERVRQVLCTHIIAGAAT